MASCPLVLQNTSHHVCGSSVRSAHFLPHLHFESICCQWKKKKWKKETNTKNAPSSNTESQIIQILMLFHAGTWKYRPRPSALGSYCLESICKIQHLKLKSRSPASAIHCDESIFLKIFPSTLVSDLVSDAHLIFMLCLQKSSITDSAVLGRGRDACVHLLLCFSKTFKMELIVKATYQLTGCAWVKGKQSA